MKPFGFLSSKQQIQTLGSTVLAGRLEKQGQKMVRSVGAWAVRTTDQILPQNQVGEGTVAVPAEHG